MKYTLHLEFDTDCENPLEDNDGMWTLYSFNRRHRNYKHPKNFFNESGQLFEQYKNLAVKGLCFVLSYYEHGGCVWSLSGEGRQCRWDTVRTAGILIWEHPEDDMGVKDTAERRQDARSTLEYYTAWANGQCFYYSISDEEANIIDSCGGFIGADDYVLETIRTALPDDASSANTYITGAARNCFDTSKLWTGKL